MVDVLVVCTGNICRSPAGELLLQGYLGADATVKSAGTHAMEGSGIPAEMLHLLDRAGIDGSSHIATQLTASRVLDATLVIAMAAQHRKWIVADAPSALKRSFLLTELAAAARLGAPLVGNTLTERLRSVWDAVAAVRPELVELETADVPDPYRRSQRDYDESFEVIAESLAEVHRWLRA
jgi:protein-tyrosine phosphatase